MSLPKALKTKDRILQISLQLFNERGERSVTTNHIVLETCIITFETSMKLLKN